MTDSLADIETLALRCRAERARDYISEAILCYRAGAYRSAIVNTWIAVVFDLVDKVRDLALTGDATAQSISNQFEGYVTQLNDGNEQGIRNALEFERTIVGTCRDRLDFFDHQQIRDLNRLREDRHQCAHPSFQRIGQPFRPTAELARLHLRNAVEHVLSQPAVQGKSAIAELVAIVSSEYFPRERALATAILRNSSLANPTNSLVRGFVDALVFGYVDSNSAIFGKPQVAAALSAILDMQRVVAEPRLAQQLSKIMRTVADPELGLVVVLVSAIREGGSLLDQPAKIRLIEFIRSGPDEDVVTVVAAFSESAEFEVVVAERLRRFDVERLSEAITKHSLGKAGKECALTLLSKARNWNDVNLIFSKLIMPLFQWLTREDVERIVRMPTETGADLPGANYYREFVEQVRMAEIIPPERLNDLLNQNGASYLAMNEQGD